MGLVSCTRSQHEIVVFKHGSAFRCFPLTEHRWPLSGVHGAAACQADMHANATRYPSCHALQPKCCSVSSDGAVPSQLMDNHLSPFGIGVG